MKSVGLSPIAYWWPEMGSIVMQISIISDTGSLVDRIPLEICETRGIRTFYFFDFRDQVVELGVCQKAVAMLLLEAK